ncbi:MAG: radical SAM protein [Deltaproteobacteria bacterium]|nr:radical SAM protein [Deltaproteobacteria bacterium]
MTRAPGPEGRGGQGKPRSVFLCSRQLGCPANLDLATQLHNYVVENRWAFTDAESADCIILVSCSILVEYRRGVVATVEYLVRRHPKKRIIVTGCFVEEDLVDAPNVTYVAMSRRDDFDALFEPAVRLRDVSPVSTAEEDQEVRSLGNEKAVFDRPYSVLVATGCLSRCHYCLEKNLFPKVHSVPLAEVVARCREGVRKGYKNFLIGATDVCSYGHDLGCDVTDLFAALFSGPFKGRPDLGVGLKALEPSRFIKHFPRLKPYFEKCRIDWIYLPIESGSDRVLKTMNRKYRVADFLRVVRELRQAAPKLRIETDFVIAYPTETREEFEASLKLVELFDHWNLVVFGRHENTRAFTMKDEFGPEERARRCEIVRSMSAQAVRSYRPECRTLQWVELPAEVSEPEIAVLSKQLAGKRL